MAEKDYEKWKDTYRRGSEGPYPWDLGRPRDFLVQLLEEGMDGGGSHHRLLAGELTAQIHDRRGIGVRFPFEQGPQMGRVVGCLGRAGCEDPMGNKAALIRHARGFKGLMIGTAEEDDLPWSR